MTLLKICGITGVEDLRMCLLSGVDIAGFNLYPESVRYAGKNRIGALLAASEGRSAIVTVDMKESELREIAEINCPAYIQLHGSEDEEYCRRIKEKFPEVKIIKKVTINMKDRFLRVLQSADYILCDVISPMHGGTGKRFNWSVIREIPENIRKKMFVAGGVTPENVSELTGLGLGGIDVASGCELFPGKKDKKKVEKLVKEVKEKKR